MDLGQESASDPTTTAQVLIALIPLKSSNASLPAVISNGLAALNAKVTISSPRSQQALAVVANLRNATVSTPAATLLNQLTATQGVDGSWVGDIQATALVARAEAAGIGRDLSVQRQVINMPDAKLRAAVNQALGRNIMDALNMGEIAQLTSLNLAGLGITNLTGLQYAVNLTNLDLRGNTISDYSPIAALTATVLKDTLVAGGESGDTPTLPEWGMLLMGSLLMLITLRHSRKT